MRNTNSKRCQNHGAPKKRIGGSKESRFQKQNQTQQRTKETDYARIDQGVARPPVHLDINPFAHGHLP